MDKKIQKIKKAIMDAFPNCAGVAVMLNDEVMDIRVIPCNTCEDEDIETIIVKGRKSWNTD